MRFVAPVREAVDPLVFDRQPLAQWREFDALLRGTDWPDVRAPNDLAARVRESSSTPVPRFVAQTPALLADGLHYEQRIAERGEVATRERNWHDLFNALVWLRYPALKAALNARQVAEIALAGPRQRTRAQCALTHFDEAGVVVVLRDPGLIAAWDRHDWHGLFWRERAAWSDGRVEAHLFGHALLEHALKAGQLLVGKALVLAVAPAESGECQVPLSRDDAVRTAAAAIGARRLLNDPQEMRPLPLSGIPGWHVDNVVESFYREAPCFCPVRSGRRYPPAFESRSFSARASGHV